MAKSKVKYYVVPLVDTIGEMVDLALNECPNKTAYKFKENNEVKSVTYMGFIGRVYGIGEFLDSKGLNGSNYACLGSNSFKWITSYFASLLSKGAFVPLDRELPQNDYLHLLKDCECKVLFYDERFEPVLKEHREELGNIEYFIGFDRKENDGEFLSYDLCLQEGEALGTCNFRRDAEKDVNRMKMLVYTSGTTGMSKGVMLSEHNLVSGVCNGLMVSTVYDTGLSILPYNHTYESVSDLLVSFHHHSTICINDKMTAVLRNMKIFQPDYIYVVPALAEMFYTRITRDIAAKGLTEQFEKLVAKSKGFRMKDKEKKRELFSFITDIFGGKLKKIVCGGAPIRPEVGEFFETIGIDLINGYGITECSPLVSVNNDVINNYNTAGSRLPCVEWKIDNPNSEGIGEILIKGDVVMLGYYHQPELTKEAIIDGWFYTGDYGKITENDQLIISGRKKNIIVLNNGKNIYPEEIEGYIQGIEFVDEVIVSGESDDNGNEKSLLAEVYLSEKKTPAQVLKSIRAACKELPVYKQISKVVIRDNEFEKTTTNKIKRFKKN